MAAPRTLEVSRHTSPILLAKVEDPSVAEIGGKAASLVRLARAGFRVPDAVVLPASWFPINIRRVARFGRRRNDGVGQGLVPRAGGSIPRKTFFSRGANNFVARPSDTDKTDHRPSRRNWSR